MAFSIAGGSAIVSFDITVRTAATRNEQKAKELC